MNPVTARLIEAALGGGLGAALGAGVGRMTGGDYPNTVPGALVGGALGAVGAPAVSAAAAARRAAPIREEAESLAQLMAYKAHRRHSDATVQKARDLAAQARQQGVPFDREGFGREATEALGGLDETVRTLQEDIRGGAEDAIRDRLSGRVFGGLRKTSAYSNSQILSPLAPADVQYRQPVGPLAGAVGGGAAWLGATAGGSALGGAVGERLQSSVLQQAEDILRQAARGGIADKRLLQRAAQLKHLGRDIGRVAPRAGLYGGALLGLPLGYSVGKWVAGSPRWGIMDIGDTSRAMQRASLLPGGLTRGTA